MDSLKNNVANQDLIRVLSALKVDLLDTLEGLENGLTVDEVISRLVSCIGFLENHRHYMILKIKSSLSKSPLLDVFSSVSCDEIDLAIHLNQICELIEVHSNWLVMQEESSL